MKLIIIICVCILSSSCSLSSKKVQDKLYYRFPEAKHLPVKKIKVEVKRPSAMGIIGNRPMVAQNIDGSLVQMQHNFWLDSPKVLLKKYLDKIFVHDIGEAKPDFTLDAEILHLEKKQQLAIIEIKFVVSDKQYKQTFNKSYRMEAQLAENTIPAFVKNIAVLLEKTVDQLIRDLQ